MTIVRWFLYVALLDNIHIPCYFNSALVYPTYLYAMLLWLEVMRPYLSGLAPLPTDH